MIITSTIRRLLVVLAGLAVLATGLLAGPASNAAASVGTGAAAGTGAGAAFRLKTFHTPSGNIQCAIVKSGGRWSMRCDVFEHDWTVAPKTCEAGDYGSSVGMGGKARPRFICVSDAIDPRGKKLRYGKKLFYGPFVCKSKRSGLKCRNRLDRGWFLSRQTWRFL